MPIQSHLKLKNITIIIIIKSPNITISRILIMNTNFSIKEVTSTVLPERVSTVQSPRSPHSHLFPKMLSEQSLLYPPPFHTHTHTHRRGAGRREEEEEENSFPCTQNYKVSNYAPSGSALKSLK